MLGLPLHRRDAPYQGLAREVDLFGTVRRVGFYSSFTALSDTSVTLRCDQVKLEFDRSAVGRVLVEGQSDKGA